MSTLKALAKNWSMDHKERCKFIFNNEILSDVKFVVQASQNPGQNGERDSKRSKIVIPAHKFLLSICSPVFFAMFCGQMAETKEHIDLPDCEYEGMFELLRYIYTDEVCLNGDNVMQVMYLAEKYMIPGLTSECTAYLGKNLDLSNVLCVLKHAQQYDNKDLRLHCWDLIDKETDEALKSSEFMSMERSFLNQLVERNTLSVREVELFKAFDCWAKEECKRQNLKVDGSVKRQVLGEQIVKNIRFPAMKKSDFMEVIFDSKILTQEETTNIMKYFSSNLTSPVGFQESDRGGSCLRCNRALKGIGGYCGYLNNIPGNPAYLAVTVDEDIMLYGVSIYDNNYDDYSVTLKISDDEDSVVAAKTGEFTSHRIESETHNFFTYYGFDVLFDVPVTLKRNIEYSLEASIDGPPSCVQDFVCNDVNFEGVAFNFKQPGYKEEEEDEEEDLLLDYPDRIAELLFKVKE